MNNNELVTQSFSALNKKLKQLEYYNFNNILSNTHLYLFKFGPLKRVLMHEALL